MAVSRQTSLTSGIPGATKRYSFAKIKEPIEVPGLLDLQRDSFAWLIGAPEWRVKKQAESEEGARITSGLEDILEELSPIEDYSGNMSLTLSEPRFDDVKNTIDEAKDKDINYSAPLYVTAEFTNAMSGEIKSQTVFIGDFPMMTDKGTFIINGTERVIVSQLVRSPGVYFDESIDKSTERPLHSVKVIPSRGAWLEFDIDKRDTVGVRIDRKRRQPVTVLLKALGLSTQDITDRFGFSELMMSTLEHDGVANTDEALLEIYRKQRPGESPTRDSAQALLDNSFFNPKRYDLAKVGRYKVNRKLGLGGGSTTGEHTLTEEDILTTIEYLVRLHAGERTMESPDGTELMLSLIHI